MFNFFLVDKKDPKRRINLGIFVNEAKMRKVHAKMFKKFECNAYEVHLVPVPKEVVETL